MRGERQSWGLAVAVSIALMFVSLGVHSPPVVALFHLLHLNAPVETAILWDTYPYHNGIAKMAAGLTPYDDYLTTDLPFTYPPIFGRVAVALQAILPPPIGWRLYETIYFLSVVGIQAILIHVFLRRIDRPQWLTLLLLSPLCLIASTIFWSGNMHAIWLMLGLMAAPLGIRRNLWWPFYLVMLLAMINKPVFATLLIIPIFAGTGQLIPAILTGAFAIAAYLSQRILDPILYLQFQQAIAGHLGKTHFYGQAVFGILAGSFYRLHLPATAIAAAVHIAFCGGVMFMLWRYRDSMAHDDPRWLALLIVAAIAMNPREMPYDAALGAIPAIFLLLQRPPYWQWIAAILITIVSVTFHNAIGFTALILVALGSGLDRLRPSSRVVA